MPGSQFRTFCSTHAFQKINCAVFPWNRKNDSAMYAVGNRHFANARGTKGETFASHSENEMGLTKEYIVRKCRHFFWAGWAHERRSIVLHLFPHFDVVSLLCNLSLQRPVNLIQHTFIQIFSPTTQIVGCMNRSGSLYSMTGIHSNAVFHWRWEGERVGRYLADNRVTSPVPDQCGALCQS